MNVPAPDLVMPPEPEIIPEESVAYAPFTVNKNPPFVIVPVKVSPPEPEEVMVAAAVNVIGIDKDAAEALEFSKAPEVDTPVPAISITFQVESVCALISKAPPDSTIIELVKEPVHEVVGL